MVKMAFSSLFAPEEPPCSAHESEQAQEENVTTNAVCCHFGSYPNKCSPNAVVWKLEHIRMGVANV